MPERTLQTINEVLAELDAILADCAQRQSPLGYFAALYRRVTAEVQLRIQKGYFDDAARMERLDVVFAQRYLDAYQAFRQSGQPSAVWTASFQQEQQYWPLVMQHLLLGMHAHIGLDLGIAAATVAKGEPLEPLKNDFIKINAVLDSLVDEVQRRLIPIWPGLGGLLQRTGYLDNYVVDVVMQIRRDEAWALAQQLHALAPEAWPEAIAQKDAALAKKAEKMVRPALPARAVLGLFRLLERGTISEKLHHLAD